MAHDKFERHGSHLADARRALDHPDMLAATTSHTSVSLGGTETLKKPTGSTPTVLLTGTEKGRPTTQTAASHLLTTSEPILPTPSGSSPNPSGGESPTSPFASPASSPTSLASSPTSSSNTNSSSSSFISNHKFLLAGVIAGFVALLLIIILAVILIIKKRRRRKAKEEAARQSFVAGALLSTSRATRDFGGTLTKEQIALGDAGLFKTSPPLPTGAAAHIRRKGSRGDDWNGLTSRDDIHVVEGLGGGFGPTLGIDADNFASGDDPLLADDNRSMQSGGVRNPYSAYRPGAASAALAKTVATSPAPATTTMVERLRSTRSGNITGAGNDDKKRSGTGGSEQPYRLTGAFVNALSAEDDDEPSYAVSQQSHGPNNVTMRSLAPPSSSAGGPYHHHPYADPAILSSAVTTPRSPNASLPVYQPKPPDPDAKSQRVDILDTNVPWDREKYRQEIQVQPQIPRAAATRGDPNASKDFLSLTPTPNPTLAPTPPESSHSRGKEPETSGYFAPSINTNLTNKHLSIPTEPPSPSSVYSSQSGMPAPRPPSGVPLPSSGLARLAAMNIDTSTTVIQPSNGTTSQLSNYYTPVEVPSDLENQSPTSPTTPVNSHNAANAPMTLASLGPATPTQSEKRFPASRLSTKQTKAERAQNLKALGNLIAALDGSESGEQGSPSGAAPPGYTRSLTAQSVATGETMGSSSTGTGTMPSASLWRAALGSSPTLGSGSGSGTGPGTSPAGSLGSKSWRR